jgi:2-iminobutanoate/2-iminopropanoate deaminase
MERKTYNAPTAPKPYGGYAQAHEVQGAERWLFISGQIPETADGTLPADFVGQCRLVWANIRAQLEAAGMTIEHLVKVTIFLSSRNYIQENRQVRAEVLGSHTPAMTVIITGIFDERWLLEIEAIAAA